MPASIANGYDTAVAPLLFIVEAVMLLGRGRSGESWSWDEGSNWPNYVSFACDSPSNAEKGYRNSQRDIQSCVK